MRELETEGTYKDQLKFTIVAPEEAGFTDAVKQYELGTHGLVGLSPAGEQVVSIPGHEFGRPEIEAAIAQLLGG